MKAIVRRILPTDSVKLYRPEDGSYAIFIKRTLDPKKRVRQPFLSMRQALKRKGIPYVYTIPTYEDRQRKYPRNAEILIATGLQGKTINETQAAKIGRLYLSLKRKGIREIVWTAPRGSLQ